MDADDLHAIGLDVSGIVDLDDYTREVALIVGKVARAEGCTCTPKLTVVRPFPGVMGVGLQHEGTCRGLLQARGAGGMN